MAARTFLGASEPGAAPYIRATRMGIEIRHATFRYRIPWRAVERITVTSPNEGEEGEDHVGIEVSDPRAVEGLDRVSQAHPAPMFIDVPMRFSVPAAAVAASLQQARPGRL